MRVSPNALDVTRRRVVKSGLAAVLASGCAPALLYADDKSPSAETIIGDGDYRYRCTHDWAMPNLPDGANYGNASHGVAVDKAGLIYVTHYGKPASIFVFDPDGKFVKSLVPEDMNGGHGVGHGIDIREEDGEEFIYLAPSESNKSFHKVSLKGEAVWSIGKDQFVEAGVYKPNSRYRPTNTSFSPDGGFFLGDGYGSNFIMQYDKDGNFVRAIGGGGKEDGKFNTPHGQWLDARDGTPKLAVCDRANARLQWFDMDGKHLRTQPGFLFPADIDVRGDLMLVPDLHCRITLLDKDNNVLTQLGGHDTPDETFDQWKGKALAGFKMRNQRPNWKPGRFVHPHDACFDADGNIFIAEWVNTGRLTKLTRV